MSEEPHDRHGGREEPEPFDPGAVLEILAAALFPSGVGTLSQLTWPAPGGNGGAVATRAAPATGASPDITELRYRTLIEQIPAVTFMAALGEESNEIYISPHIERLLGFTQQEWLQDPFLWYRQLHPDDRDLWHEEFTRGCQTGGPFRAECRFLARDGRVVWVRGEARLVKDDLGRPLFLQGVAFDITESKKAEARVLTEAVRTAEARYRDLVEQLGAIFWEAEPGRPGFTFVSRGAAQVLGYPPDRWLSDPEFLLGLVHPDDRTATAAMFARAYAGVSAGEEVDFRAVAADGRVLWLHQRVTVSTLPDGTRRVLGVIFDVTARKEAENVLRANEARLRTETDIGRALHRIGSTLASELDLERLVQLATDEATRLTTAEFGAFFYNVTDARGESYMLYSLSGASREAFANFPLPRNTAIFARTFSGAGIVRLDDVTKDARYGRNPPYHGMPPGHLPVRSYLAVPVISRAGEVIGGLFFGHSRPGVFTAAHEDLAAGIAGWAALAIDNARLFQAAEASRQAAETANRAKDEFLATMSHELRTPLNAVLGWATILKAADAPEIRERGLETIERNARAQSKLIEDLLDVSRIVTGKMQLEAAPVDLVSVVESALDAIRLGAQAKGLTLERRLDRSARLVMGDATRLHQVVSNLLTNAVKFTPATGRISVRLEPVGGLARLTVSDTGEGIAPDFLPYVFDRFRQADSSSTRRHGGLGLGLSIVRHLVELHGGRASAESDGPGLGSTFTVELPLIDADQRKRAAGSQPAPSAAREAPRPLDAARILLVEDDEDSRQLLAVMLEDAGAMVTSRASAADALEALKTMTPDAIVSDIGLPGQDGYSFIRSVRAGRHRAVPAIAVTAYARAEDRAQALAAGFQAHLAKPILPEDLVATIRRVVGR